MLMDNTVLVQTGSALASWTPLTVLLGIYAAIVVALVAFGRSDPTLPRLERVLLRIPDALERLTGVPGWAAAAVGTSLYGLLVAGEGFYSDVAWHVALGRDSELFTAPHTSIVLGLGFITVASAVGVLFATLGRVAVGFRVGALRVPWSMVPLAVLGVSAVSGFPLDEVWHREYGVDVTMWSPTHMLMILGASFSGLASWLVLADAKVPTRGSAWFRGLHVVAAWLTLQGLASSQGEFAFGVPQFQQIFHPILVCLAAGFALVAIRLVLGRGWALGIAIGSFLFDSAALFGGEAGGPVDTRTGGIYLASALAVELVAHLAGTERRLRFGVLSGLVVGTVGLAGEWAYNQGAYQPWRSALLPDAVILGVVVAVGAAVLATAFARAVTGGSHPSERAARATPVGGQWLIAAGAAVLLVLALPMPRGTGDVTADLRVDQLGDEALVEITLSPADAADDARWFQTIAWQGGELVIAEMDEVAPGTYVADKAVPVTGLAKSLVRLHRGGELMAVPVRFPDDPEIGAPEIPAEGRTVAFEAEQQFLLRETRPGSAWLEIAIYALLGIVALVWITAFVVTARRVGPPSHAATSATPEPVRR
ncbi:hypothetical protein BH20ACT2_BH20ACT2_00540 [soil metagenome]